METDVEVATSSSCLECPHWVWCNTCFNTQVNTRANISNKDEENKFMFTIKRKCSRFSPWCIRPTSHMPISMNVYYDAYENNIIQNIEIIFSKGTIYYFRCGKDPKSSVFTGLYIPLHVLKIRWNPHTSYVHIKLIVIAGYFAPLFSIRVISGYRAQSTSSIPKAMCTLITPVFVGTW